MIGIIHSKFALSNEVDCGRAKGEVEKMANHKRRRPKNRRSGCLLCKSWKVNGFGKDKPEREPFSDYKRRKKANDEIKNWKD